MIVRRCEQADFDSWKKLNREFMEYEYHDENVWENPMEKGDMAPIFDAALDENSPTRLYIIEEDGRAIGFMNTVWFISLWAYGKVLFLDDFFLTEEYRGRGIGAKALAELERQIKSDGFVRLQLLAEYTNPGAVKFYERENYDKQEINFFCKYL